MAAATISYFAIKLEFIQPLIANMPWPSPVGIGAFIGTGGDWKAGLVAILCAVVAFVIWLPFAKFYDAKLLAEESATEVGQEA